MKEDDEEFSACFEISLAYAELRGCTEGGVRHATYTQHTLRHKRRH